MRVQSPLNRGDRHLRLSLCRYQAGGTKAKVAAVDTKCDGLANGAGPHQRPWRVYGDATDQQVCGYAKYDEGGQDDSGDAPILSGGGDGVGHKPGAKYDDQGECANRVHQQSNCSAHIVPKMSNTNRHI